MYPDCCHHHPRETLLFQQARRDHLGRELGKLAIFEGCNIEDLLDANDFQMPEAVYTWLHRADCGIELAAQMAWQYEQFAERRALVNERFTEEAKEWTHSWTWSSFVNIIGQSGDRRTELRDKLTVFGLVLREDCTMCRAYIRNAFGNADEIVTYMREMEWFLSCTTYGEADSMECCLGGSRDSTSYCNDCADHHFRGRGYYDDHDYEKQRSLDRWVRRTIPKGVKLLGDFLETGRKFSRVPPESLHAKINELIELKFERQHSERR